MGMHIVRPTKNLDKHLAVLESLIKLDKKQGDMKSLKYHEQALQEIKKQM